VTNAPYHKHCWGLIKAVYVREGKTWLRVGSLCLKCKTFSDQPLIAEQRPGRKWWRKHPERVLYETGRDFAPPEPRLADDHQ
jgi:hypothetical protein